ncbi:MAG: hypothetical protein GX624_00930 [Actinobacteria bacterium]|nr:hypothetical protein [Actinomycetota bacterium]
MRLRTVFISLLLAILAVSIFAGPAAAKDPSVPKLKRQLRAAKQHRDKARERTRRAVADLKGARALHAATNALGSGVVSDPAAVPVVIPAAMDPALAAKLLADGVVTADEVAAQQKRKSKAKRLERKWTARVRSLKKRIRTLEQIADWNRRGQWKPLIRIACKKYRVSAHGLHRLMILESGGRRTAGTMYKGLFQYYPSTWSGSWNPWRRESIFNGWAQIRATAYAISRGMGPSQWPNTYPMAF